jgi:CRP-like cAMP-binding protein
MNRANSDRPALEAFVFLASLTPDEREAVARDVVPVSFGAGTAIVHEGDRNATAFLITEGEVEVRTTIVGSTRTAVVAILRAGDVFGEMSLLTGDPRRASGVARTPVTAFRLERDPIEACLRARPALVEVMADEMSSRLLTLRTAQGVEDECITGGTARVRLRQGLIRRIRRTCMLDHVPAEVAHDDAVLVRGRLLFLFPRPGGADAPLHHIAVEVWRIDPTEQRLGAALTDLDGRFAIPVHAGRSLHTVELRVLESQHTYTERGELVEQWQQVHVARTTWVEGASAVEFGDVRVPYWEYAPDADTPRTFFLEHGDPPQHHPAGRALVMLQTVGPIERIKQNHLRACREGDHAPDLDRIQNDYPENLTRRCERESPGVTRSDAWFGDRMLNGMTASVFDRVDERPEQFRIYHHWNGYDQNGVYALPNVDMRFVAAGDSLVPVEITLQVRDSGVAGAHAPTQRITARPADGPLWLQAKRIARTSAALVAELDQHLISTHLNVEQYAIAAYRNLRRNPIRMLLFPHIRDVALSNRTADGLLLGATGFLTRATALSAAGLQQRIRDVLGSLDWRDWRPQVPVCPAHRAARAGQLFWAVLGEYIDDFFAQHADGIAENWREIRLFSDDLTAHAMPAFVCRFLRATVAGRSADQCPWFNTDERMNLEAHRPDVDEAPRAIHPLTHNDSPEASDWAALKQCCRYVIYHATFKHTWANQRQYDEGGELRYATLSLRYGRAGLFGPEDDETMLPPPAVASELLWIAYMLSHAVYGRIMQNEDRDIPPSLRELLGRRRAQFADVGFDIDCIQSRTNI